VNNEDAASNQAPLFLLSKGCWCHPEQLTCLRHAARDKAACAPFSKESRIKFAKATKFDIKSGEAEGSKDLQDLNRRPGPV
jgi:hypothetical protein